ncbi:MAG: hypothetical protein PVJ43_12865, partial [Gemmatimonadales bacterium]|jgi:hypothetical protein
MKLRLVPSLGVAYFLAMAFFVTYPGYVPFDKIQPFVFGLPFSLFWQVLWICGAVFVLAAVFFWETNRKTRSIGSNDRANGPARPSAT